MPRGATCHECGEAFIPKAWQRGRGRLLCSKCNGGATGDPRDTAEARRVRAIVLHDNPYCYWCGEVATTIDHYPIPIIKGGPTTIDNVVPACAPCNKSRQENPGPPKRVIRLA